MQPHIREKRKFNFSYKVIRPELVQKIAKIIEQESNAENAKGGFDFFVIYSVDATDNSSYESQSSLIFNEGGLLDTKVIQKIQMRFQTSNYEKSIEVQFQQTQKEEPGNNYINVSGDDTTWVNGMISRFSEIVNFAQAQPKTHRIIDNLIIPVTVLFNVLFFRLFYGHIETLETEWIKSMFILGTPIGSLMLFNRTSEYLKTFWPYMELQTGPGHLQVSSEKRRKVKWVVSAIFIPLVIGFLYDLLKSVIYK